MNDVGDPSHALILDAPSQIVDEERHGLAHGKQLMVIEEDDTARPNQSAQINEVDEHSIKAMVAVDEGEVECAAF